MKKIGTATLYKIYNLRREMGLKPFVFNRADIRTALYVMDHPEETDQVKHVNQRYMQLTEAERDYEPKSSVVREWERLNDSINRMYQGIDDNLVDFLMVKKLVKPEDFDPSSFRITSEGYNIVFPLPWRERNKQIYGIIVGSVISFFGAAVVAFTSSYLDKVFWKDKIQYIKLTDEKASKKKETKKGPELKALK